MKGSMLLFLPLSLCGCASMSDTSDGLVSSTDIHETKCYAQASAAVEVKVREFLERCYATRTVVVPVAGIPVPMTSSFQVVEERADNRDRISVRTKYGFGISVDIRPDVEGCQSRVDMYALRSHLREKFARIDAAINDQNPGCGII